MKVIKPSLLNSLTFSAFLISILSSCTPPRVPWTGEKVTTSKLEIKALPLEKRAAEGYEKWEDRTYRPRSPLPENPNSNEDSLWGNEASWGNLFRDKKARFLGDIVHISNIATLITSDRLSDDLSTDEASTLAEEIAAVESRIDKISAEVSKVLPNGNLALYAQKITFSNDDKIRYVTTVTGYARVTDINENNEIDATRLARSSFKTTKGYNLTALKTSRKPAAKNETSQNTEITNFPSTDQELPQSDLSEIPPVAAESPAPTETTGSATGTETNQAGNANNNQLPAAETTPNNTP